MQWFSKSRGKQGGVGQKPFPGGEGESRPRLAVAHFMLGNTYPFTEEDWLKTFDLAQDTSLDALALNLGPEEWQLTQASTASRLLSSSHLKLKLFLSLDLMVLPKDPDLISTKVIQIIQSGKAAQLKWDNKIVLSTFGGQDLGDKGWREVIRGVESTLGEKVFFIPSFFLPPEVILAKDYVDGAFDWNGAWPMNNHTINLDSDKPFLSHNKPYMASVSPLFFTHYGTEGDWAFNKNWIYRSDDLLLPTRFQQLLSLPPDQSPQCIEIISWNDFGESHYIGPVLGAQPGSERWTEGMDHEGFRVMIKYYVEKWKNQVRHGKDEASSSDGSGKEEKGKMVVWYRTQSRDMSAAEDRVGKPDHSEWAQDLLNFFILLPSPQYSLKDTFTLHVQNGGHSHRPISLDVGSVNLVPVPFFTGQVTFQVMRGAREVVMDGKGRDIVEGGGWNYNMWSGVFDAIS
ncbi:hypothetical protein I302_106764 [Kwoniella bestiolae CBS 10118]|uniref:Glycoside hydrolase family 71 protein n=1 Tax=Kwoniella bestiolae CBS 10118 TaxID=1296100 RepID=A0A1B9G0H0_9TREE|nr:hypothetical protein I302_05970 [Kwoniella bestiolae CBS 10118]OCF24510.1 hypothetical protein I302_05970 [Kwoniella bestiolae CBS 10118]